MVPTLRKLSSIFISLLVLLIGHGLQQTLLPLVGQSYGWSSAAIGVTGAAYFCGFILGCFRIPRWVRRVGHARVFAACAGLAIVAILMVTYWPHIVAWMVVRALTGFCFAGLYLIIESWLNEQAPSESRGSILSLYGFISLAAMAAGQMLVTTDLGEGSVLVAIILALAILPIALTSTTQPEQPYDVEPAFGDAYRASQVAPVCAATSGFVMGLVWSSGAVYASSATADTTAGPAFIISMLLGGLCTQLPAGRISDIVDRRFVLLSLASAGLIASLTGIFGTSSVVQLTVIAFFLGAAALPMYSLAIAHANDNAEGQFLAIGGALLVANAAGAVAGPLMYAGLAATGLTDSFFYIMATAFLISLVWTAQRIAVHDVEREYFEPFQAVPRTTQAAVELDPRAEADSQT